MLQSLVENLRFEQDTTTAKQDRSIATIQGIINQAIPLFAQNGYESTSTHAIAAAAGVNQGLIAYHFGSKENLWKAAIDHAVGTFRNRLCDEALSISANDFEAYFKLILGFYVKWASESQDVTRILIELNKSDNELRRWYVERHIRPIYQFLVHLIVEGQRLGFIREHPPESIYYLLITSNMVFTLSREAKQLADIRIDSPDYIASQSAMLFDMLWKPEATVVNKPSP